MNRNYQALLCAQFVISFFTLDTTGLTRVDHHGYHPVNNTLPNQKPWNQQQQPYAQQNTATTRNPQQGWPSGQLGGNNANANANQWNWYNQTGNSSYNGNQNPTMANQWQRYNNTLSQPGTYNSGIAGWNPQQQQPHFPNNSATNWQRPGQSHLYPQLPQPNPSWTGVRQQPIAPTSPSSFGSNRWNNTYMPPQQYPGGTGRLSNQNNWPIGQNRTSWGSVAPTAQPSNIPIYSKNVPPNVPNGFLQNQTGVNWFNRPNATNNNNGWSATPAAGQYSWSAGGQNNWKNNPSNPKSNSDNNDWSNNGAQNKYNNWPSSQGSQGTQGISGGTPLAPIGQSVGDIPLAPIGDSNSANPWNAGSYSSPQLAPLAPLPYGGGNNPYDPSKKGNTNPYAGMFN